MGRMYSVVVPSISITLDQDLVFITAGTNNSIILHSAKFTQKSEEGDAEAEMLSIQILIGATVGSVGSTQTPQSLNSGSQASDASARKNDTTIHTGGTVVDEEDFNVQIGYFYKPTPEERIEIPGAGTLAFYLTDDPTDAITVSGTVIFEEIG